MFLKQEEENFALFNYVNELNHELEGLSDSIAKLRVNIDEQRLLNNKRAEKQMNTLNVLKEKAEKAKHEVRYFEIFTNLKKRFFFAFRPMMLKNGCKNAKETSQIYSRASKNFSLW